MSRLMFAQAVGVLLLLGAVVVLFELGLRWFTTPGKRRAAESNTAAAVEQGMHYCRVHGYFDVQDAVLPFGPDGNRCPSCYTAELRSRATPRPRPHPCPTCGGPGDELTTGTAVLTDRRMCHTCSKPYPTTSKAT